MSSWNNVKKILCIRPDNMGDLVMSGPAIRALKHGSGAHITVLTSSMAAGIAKFMPEIDEVIVFDLPWVKANRHSGADDLNTLIGKLRGGHFDAAVIFTVFSQNPLPSAMIAYQAGITKVLAYCRENPYGLISDWVVEQEPYAYIRHQVKRDLDLVKEIFPIEVEQRLQLMPDETLWPIVETKLSRQGLDPERPWLVLHPGVSEAKRLLPEHLWIAVAKDLIDRGYQILLTGAPGEKELTSRLCSSIGDGATDAAGLFSLAELITLLSHAPLLLSVNTGTVHLAAAVQTPVVVLYAQTNPQHTPWMVPNKVIEFPVPANLKSKNAIIRHVDDTTYAKLAPMPDAATIVSAVLTFIKLPAV